jgi:molybdenum cofactor cytidylyltransferase
MGRPKQLLHLGKKMLLERALANVRRANVAEMVLVLGFAAQEIQRKISLKSLVVVANEKYEQGMGTSLRLGLSSVSPQAAGALIVLGDQPFVRPATLDRMIEFHRQHRPQILVPMYKGFRGNPVLLDRCVFPELRDLTGDIGCRAIFGSHTEGISKLSVDDPGILLDVDTIQDLQALATLCEDGESETILLSNNDLETACMESAALVSRSELVVVGRDAVALMLVRLGRLLRFTTTVVDPFLTLAYLPEADRILHRLDFSLLPQNQERFIVVASRGQFDEEALEQAFSVEASYLGLVANKGRREELLRILKNKGLSQKALARLHAPAGLKIGAEAPEEIALSIMAQIVAERKATKSSTCHGDTEVYGEK